MEEKGCDDSFARYLRAQHFPQEQPKNAPCHPPQHLIKVKHERL